MDANARVAIDISRTVAWRRPYIDLIAGRAQTVRNRARVVRYSTALGRVFAGDDVPFQSCVEISVRLLPL